MDKYAVMGNPIAHSKSPVIHTMFAKQTGQILEYRAILVAPDDFELSVRQFGKDGGKGLNITVPFKQEAWQWVDARTPEAEKAGAVNTIVFQKNGSTLGANTDGIGIVRDLMLNQGIVLNNKRVLILGAGGAVRGVLQPILEQHPAVVCIANRTKEKAVELAQMFSEQGCLEGYGFDDLPSQSFDLIINGTSASLAGDVPPVNPQAVAGAFCYDMMYGAKPTVFMQWCEQHGALKTCDGLGMLVEQAAESFFLWRGVKPETKPVIKTIRAGL